MKKFLLVCFTFVFFIGILAPPFSALREDATLDAELMNHESVKAIIAYVEAVSNQDLDTIVSLSPSNEKEEWITFFADDERKDTGFRSILNAEITILEPVKEEQIMQNTNLDYYLDKYGNTVEGHLVGTTLVVKEDKEYFHYGLNLHLVLTATEEGEKKIVEYSEPSLMVLHHVFDDERIKSDADLQKAFEYKEAKARGITLDSKGNVLMTNIASPEKIMEQEGRGNASL